MSFFKQRNPNLIAEETEILPRPLLDNVILPVLFGTLGFGLFYLVVSVFTSLNS